MFPVQIADEAQQEDREQDYTGELANYVDRLVNECLSLLHLHLDGVGDGVTHNHRVGIGVVNEPNPVFVACLRHVDGVAFRKDAYAIMQIDTIRLDEAVGLAYIPIPVLRDWNVFLDPASCQRSDRHGKHGEREPLYPISSHNHVVLLSLKEPIGLPPPAPDEAVELSPVRIHPLQELRLNGRH